MIDPHDDAPRRAENRKAKREFFRKRAKRVVQEQGTEGGEQSPSCLDGQSVAPGYGHGV